jgi:hypothetical protein
VPPTYSSENKVPTPSLKLPSDREKGVLGSTGSISRAGSGDMMELMGGGRHVQP